ncbi:MAG: IPT/TIG domain-containing protein, partial [Bacteroidetes bacterium]|nr:IPT/TIG domain-containing protein [Bacteroidota bacterium]
MRQKLLLLIPVVILGIKQINAGCPLINVSLQDRINQSEIVVEAKVINKNPYFNSKENFIYTAQELVITRIFKGNITSGTIVLITEGGVVGNKALNVYPNLNTEIGQTGIFFLSHNKKWETLPGITQSYFSPIGPLGFIYYDFNKIKAYDEINHWGNITTELFPKIISFTNKNEVIRESETKKHGIRRATPVITGFSPDSIHAGTQEVLTITGTDFGATQGSGNVYFANANDGGATYVAARTGDIISWSNTKIELKVTSAAGTGKFFIEDNSANQSALSSNDLTIPWAHLNIQYANNPPSAVTSPFEIRHQDINGSGGITWTWDTDFNLNDNAKAAFLRALENWRCKTLINWSVSGVKTNASNSKDGDCMVYY